jgi:hypothetical protein
LLINVFLPLPPFGHTPGPALPLSSNHNDCNTLI